MAGFYLAWKDFERSINPPSRNYTHDYSTRSMKEIRIEFATQTTKENKSVTVVTSGSENTTVTFITTQKRLQELCDEVLNETSIELLTLYGFRELRITCPDFKEAAVIVNLETGKVDRMSF